MLNNKKPTKDNDHALTLDQAQKMRKLMQTPFKIIRFQQSGKSLDNDLDGEIALFLLSLDAQPDALVPSQTANFAKEHSLSVELLDSLRLQMRKQRAVAQNAERLVLGRTYRKLMPSALGGLHQKTVYKKSAT